MVPSLLCPHCTLPPPGTLCSQTSPYIPPGSGTGMLPAGQRASPPHIPSPTTPQGHPAPHPLTASPHHSQQLPHYYSAQSLPKQPGAVAQGSRKATVLPREGTAAQRPLTHREPPRTHLQHRAAPRAAAPCLPHCTEGLGHSAITHTSPSQSPAQQHRHAPRVVPSARTHHGGCAITNPKPLPPQVPACNATPDTVLPALPPRRRVLEEGT